MWEKGSRKILITFNDDKHGEELHKHIRLNTRVTLEIREHLIAIVKKYRGDFCKEDEKRTILGYKLSINTVNVKTVWYQKP